MEVDEDVRALVEDTTLPRRLKEDVYEEVAARGDLSLEAVDEVVQAVESRYLDTRVDPLDPVGTVSAQSIGEPGTQMSVPAEERVIVRRNGETDVTEIGGLVDGLAAVRETRSVDGHEVVTAPENMEVLSLRADERVAWKPLDEVSRHEAPPELLRFELESGRDVRATKSHSFVTRRDNEVVPVPGEELTDGDWLPVVRSFDGNGPGTVNLREYLDSDDYWFTSTLTDGGVAADSPAGKDQTRNKREALAAGELDEGAVYPRSEERV